MSNRNCSPFCIINLSGYIYSNLVNLLDENISYLFNTLYTFINEPRCEKKTQLFAYAKTKEQISCRVNVHSRS